MSRRPVISWQQIVRWSGRWGFAFGVIVAALAAAYSAWKAGVPQRVPAFALHAEAVYRVEVGAAVFAGPYLALMALALALHNRAFSEIGFNGLKAQDLAGRAQQTAFSEQTIQLEALRTALELVEDAVEEISK